MSKRMLFAFVATALAVFAPTLSQAKASDMTWEEIQRSPFYEVYTPSMKMPTDPYGREVSLMNLCVLEDDRFLVLNPEPPCLQEETFTVGTNPKDAYLVERCTLFGAPQETILPSVYTPCKTYEHTYSDGPIKDQRIIASTCIEEGTPTKIPTQQMVDVYMNKKDYRFAFRKSFEVLPCAAQGTPVPVADKKAN